MAKVRIRLPAALSDRTCGISLISVEAGSVGDALSELGTLYPEVGRLLFAPGGDLRPFVHLFVGEQQVTPGGGQALRDGDELRIVPSIAGG